MAAAKKLRYGNDSESAQFRGDERRGGCQGNLDHGRGLGGTVSSPTLIESVNCGEIFGSLTRLLNRRDVDLLPSPAGTCNHDGRNRWVPHHNIELSDPLAI